MRIVIGFPPNIESILEVFPITGSEIFAYGDTIYNPSGASLTPALIAHEGVHSRQQGDDVEGWWDRYLVDEKFRFQQELEAHQQEYKTFSHFHRDRNTRFHYLAAIAKRLAGKLYGSLVSAKDARKLIKQ